MPNMILNRNYALVSIHGRAINFEKNVPVWVPPQCVQEALMIGAEDVDDTGVTLTPTEDAPVVELTIAEREEKVLAVFKRLKARNERGDFTAQGVPNIKVVATLSGIDLVTKERDELWTKFKAAEAAAENE